MTAAEVLILSLVQGVTEFLPISSSGHLLLARLWLGIPDVDGTTFDAFLHLGTLGAVLFYYWRAWFGISRSLWQSGEEARDKRELLGKLLAATIPSAAAGYLFKGMIAETLRGPHVLALSFLFTAFVLWWFDRPPSLKLRRTSPPTASPAAQPASTSDATPRLSWRDAVIIGLTQVAALVPAISRSGVTIAAGRARGLSRKQATTFSFLLSAPIIAGASVSSLTTLLQNGSVSSSLLILGTTVSFVSGLLSIYLLMRFVERISFLPFAVYLAVLSGVIWIVA